MTSTPTKSAFRAAVMIGVASLALMGCSTLKQFEASFIKADSQSTGATTMSAPGVRGGANVRSVEPVAARAAPAQRARGASSDDIAALVGQGDVSAVLVPQALPEFIDTAFGSVLGLRYVTGPGIATRDDVVTLRSPQGTPRSTFFAMAQVALAQYGITVAINDGLVVLSEGASESASAPLVTRSRAPSEPASSSRTVVQIIEMTAVDVKSLVGLLDSTFSGRGSVKIEAREDINSLVVTGAPRDVARVASVVDRLDVPRFANGKIGRVQPTFWSADQLVSAVGDVMAKEGFRVSTGTAPEAAGVVFFAIPFTNEFLVFSNQPAAFERALHWVRELDQPAAFGNQEGVFIYQVENTSAGDLGALVATAFAGSSSSGAATPAAESSNRRSLQRPATGVDDSQSVNGRAAGVRLSDKITVDAGSNRILFRGSASEFAQMRTLLSQLDTPPRQVLVEMTIAEVTLTDETKLGVEWFLNERYGDGTITLDTRGGSDRGAGGLGAVFSRIYSKGRMDTILNALATNKNINILSTPRLLSRSGGTAEILVGTDVPIITSQRAANTQNTGSSDILQTVQYRQTGIILNVRPIVYGDDRVAIEIYQEVSTQEPNRTSAISSPIIQNRSVSTQLALREGMTAVIGGLLQDNFSREQRGVPILKDLPIVGSAFRTDAVGGGKVELLILMTPYIIRDDGDLSGATELMVDSLNATLTSRGTQVYTLLPFVAPWAAPVRRESLRDATPAEAAPNTTETQLNNKE